MRLKEEFGESETFGENPGLVSVPDRPVSPKREKPVRVAWGMPMYGPMYSEVYTSHMATIAYASRYFTVEHLGDIPMIGATDKMYLHSASNEIVKQVLAEPAITHIFWTEMDMILPPDTIPRLLAVGKPIVSGVYFLRGGSGQPCLYAPPPCETIENPYVHTPITMYDERAPFRLANGPGGCCGMGCVLFERQVFERVAEPWFDLKANDPGKKNGYGQDLYFYTKVRNAGLEVWVDPGVVCDQIDKTIVGYQQYRERLARSDPGLSGGYLALDAGTPSSAA